MKNVYDQVHLFYNKEVTDETIVKREWVEGFFRYKAWQGVVDEELQTIWQSIQLFIIYLQYSDNDEIEALSVQDCSLLVEWLSVHVKGFKLSLSNVRKFFTILIEFYKYLVARHIIHSADEIEHAANEISGGETLRLLKPVTTDLPLFVENMNVASDELSFKSRETAKMIGETVEQLMVKLGTYFQQENFNEDFDRALYLYTGPLETVPDDEREEFWLGFWDYFLFDYHLLREDISPLAHFYKVFSGSLSQEEQQILHDLQSSHFTVFYIDRVINQDWVECVDLFTEEKFELPFLFEYNSLKKLLFYGHIFSQGMIVINYVTSIEVSANLRRRIREEILRQKVVFERQQATATLEDFFKRHALVVRHTIDILVTLAKVNVIPAMQLEREFPKSNEIRKTNPAVIKMMEEKFSQFGFSKHDCTLMQNMWHDYCQFTTAHVRKPEVWVAAVFYSYSHVNYLNNISVDKLAKNLEISTSSIYTYKNRLYKILELETFDPRYLNEEGFVISLFLP